MNKERHIEMTCANDNNITKKINEPHFEDLNKSQMKHMQCSQVDQSLKWMFLLKSVALFMTLQKCACSSSIVIS